MPQTKVGGKIAEYDDMFAEWFEQPAKVVNYVEADDSVGEDRYRDTPAETRQKKHPDSPVETTAQVRTNEGDVALATKNYGLDDSVEVEIFLDSDVLVTSGGATDDSGNDLPYPSTITVDDQSYQAIHVIDEANGAQRVLAQFNE